MDLRELLPDLLPHAIRWAEQQADYVQAQGDPLAKTMLDVAARVGVQHPERIRVLQVEQMPFPEDPLLRQAAYETGLLGPRTQGLTLGYSIFLLKEHADVRLLSHECRHVYQYEEFGSIADFVPVYLDQLLEFGYEDSPFEVDARAYEISVI